MHKPSHTCAQPFLGLLWIYFTSKWIRLSLLSLWKSPAINLRLFLRWSICDPYLAHIFALWKNAIKRKDAALLWTCHDVQLKYKPSKLEMQTNQNPRQKKIKPFYACCTCRLCHHFKCRNALRYLIMLWSSKFLSIPVLNRNPML